MLRPIDSGNIVIVALARHVPSGHEQEGHRPAVIVGIPERVGSPRFPMVIVAPLTTQTGDWSANNPDLYPTLASGIGGLPHSSVVLLDNVRGIDAHRVVRYLGSLTPDEFAPIQHGLQLLFNLSRE